YLDPEMVKMQFQMSSMTTIGDPITYFTHYPGRFASAHLQGVNTTTGMRASQPPTLTVKREGGAGGAAGRQGRGRPPAARAAVRQQAGDGQRLQRRLPERLPRQRPQPAARAAAE